MNLEQLRKQAKELVRSARAGDADAIARARAHAPARERVILADAQLALAREHGYPSWPALVAAAEASVDTFVVAATERRRDRAERLLAARPELERDRWAALLLGRGWDGDPNEVGGPRSWPPLHYVCRSVFASAPLARDLLARGADPNAVVPGDYDPVSALYGAAGVLHDPELTRALLEAGADPNGEPVRGDALYHSVEAENTACLELLLEHGADPRGTNALLHALDYERLAPVRCCSTGARIRTRARRSCTRCGADEASSAYGCSSSAALLSIAVAASGRPGRTTTRRRTRTPCYAAGTTSPISSRSAGHLRSSRRRIAPWRPSPAASNRGAVSLRR